MQEAWSILKSLLLEIVLPGVAASAATLLLLTLVSRFLKLSAKWQFWQAPLAIAAGLIAGNFWRQDIPYWSLEHDFYSLIPASLALLFFSTLAQWHQEAQRPWLSLLAQAGGAILVAWWLTPMEVTGSRWLWIGLFVVAIRSNEFVLHRMWNDSLGRAGPSVLAVIWGGAAAALLLEFAHTMRYFDLVALFSSALLGLGVALPLTRFSARAAYATPALFFPAMMMIAQLSSDVPIASFLLIGVAPSVLLLALPELTKWIEKRSPKWRAAAAIMLLVLPLVAALTIAGVNAAKTEEEATSEQKAGASFESDFFPPHPVHPISKFSQTG